MDLHSAPYELLASSQGPVRATATVASSPFEYAYFDPFARAKG